jgi:hypothetical protein
MNAGTALVHDVIPGLDPGIHDLRPGAGAREDVDGRAEPGHDEPGHGELRVRRNWR